MTGSSLVGAFSEAGLKVAAIDAASSSAGERNASDDRGIALSLGSQRILSSLHLWAPLADVGTPIEHIHVSDQGRLGRTRLHADDFGLHAFGYVVGAGALNAALRLALDRGAQVFAPAVVERVVQDVGNVRVEFNHEGVKSQMTGALLVVCDGAKSLTRDLIAVESQQRSYDQIAITTNVETTLAHGNTAYERFTPSGPLAFLPMAGNRTALIWTLRLDEAAQFAEASDEVLLREVQARFGNRLGRLHAMSERSIHPLSLVTVANPVSCRAVVIGNAAHALHPIAGQGLNLGLRDVAVLAEKVVDAYRRGDDVGSIDVLNAYHAERAADQKITTQFTDSLVRVFCSDFAPWVHARSLGMLALDCLPVAKAALVARATGLAGKQSRLARGLAL